MISIYFANTRIKEKLQCKYFKVYGTDYSKYGRSRGPRGVFYTPERNNKIYIYILIYRCYDNTYTSLLYCYIFAGSDCWPSPAADRREHRLRILLLVFAPPATSPHPWSYYNIIIILYVHLYM